MPYATAAHAAVGAALDDIRVASRILGSSARHGVIGLDLRYLAGGAKAIDHPDPAVSDAYCGAIEHALKRLPGLTAQGYVIKRTTTQETTPCGS